MHGTPGISCEIIVIKGCPAGIVLSGRTLQKKIEGNISLFPGTGLHKAPFPGNIFIGLMPFYSWHHEHLDFFSTGYFHNILLYGIIGQ